MSNRRSPKQFTCSKVGCLVKTRQQEIKCERCHGTFHLSCSGIPKEAYEAIKAAAQLTNFIWCCDACRPEVRQAIAKLEFIESKVEKVEEKLEEWEVVVNKRLKVLEERMEKKNKEEGEKLKIIQKKTQDIEEEKEKDRRRDNLILYNIPESASQNIAERIRNDWESIKQIFERKGLQLDQKKFKNIYRLGREQTLGKTRPLLIRFVSQEAKKEILKFCNDLKFLKENESIPIYYSMDLTVKEREERKKLVEELKRLKEKGQKNLGIRNGKIVTILESRPQHISWASLFKS